MNKFNTVEANMIDIIDEEDNRCSKICITNKVTATVMNFEHAKTWDENAFIEFMCLFSYTAVTCDKKIGVIQTHLAPVGFVFDWYKNKTLKSLFSSQQRSTVMVVSPISSYALIPALQDNLLAYKSLSSGIFYGLVTLYGAQQCFGFHRDDGNLETDILSLCYSQKVA